ncbi:hypothetical protein JQU17_19815 [Ponticoccus sp. SC2-23]|uniref:WcbI family polysaccharide biosynthesis putative acetyltransferase n=1 Tax=Alexandriicola marinus TaxID=2081710 RepID=UPI000FDAF298|nr:WcbI family polysaccharide biosynthesis putative acetyltransferase [Alexandriicola marinus]MBM1222461.1 hypothetical protein [Ponticoccus sp. SC6-9]MBM1226967.1 hypothetical protein [Ponticoccus sp. SC6-15]MBM1231388.1 hypothetical protein [Ponticoccus sp. SC6-38]MBM1235961.1 hypothetical protein [Ponticoccus sp. SC6-45]MBM1240411.1 hypothetical protein [Ponticoccus sp. SC6-49]MBM1244946.1 hypothetical protein [Ponticoccus sp. SC2-64]MBM1249435.1 hypothetical protein [Ponticoccus sp. SC6-
MKALVIANCTSHTTGQLLRHSGHFTEVEAVALYALTPEKKEDLFSRLNSFDIIFTVPHNANWGDFALTNLKNSFKDKIISYAVPFFSGLHPDIVYVDNAKNARLKSPIGDYHSSLAIYGYVNGLSVREVAAIWRNEIVTPVYDVEQVWVDSYDEIRSREAGLDVKVGDIFDTINRQEVGMLTINHPSLRTLSLMAERLVNTALGGNASWIDTSTLPHNLTNDTVIPPTPSVRQAFQLPYRASELFVCGRGTEQPGEIIDFETLCDRSYRLYNEVGIENILPRTPAQLAKDLSDAIKKNLTSI